jgi:hypothetical protein
LRLKWAHNGHRTENRLSYPLKSHTICPTRHNIELFKSMLETTASSSTSTPNATRLTRPRQQAVQLLTNQIKIGFAIRSQRLTYVEDLDQARVEKVEWVNRCTDLLKQLFTDGSAAEQCNDWVGPILPEYAEFEQFVETFTNEMKHRIGRLQVLVKRLDEFAEPELPPEPEPPPPKPAPAPAATAPEPVATPTAPAKARPTALIVLRAVDENVQTQIKEAMASLGLSAHVMVLAPQHWGALATFMTSL